MVQQRRRRIDRVTAPDFLEGMEQRPLPELRAMRDEAREEEARLSYIRRLLQARVDIAQAEGARRRGELPGGLLDALPSILADDDSARRPQPYARVAPMYTPGEEQRRSGDQAADESLLARLPDMDDDELAGLTERTVEEERATSELRRRVLDTIDALEAEITARLRQDTSSLDEIVRAHGEHEQG